MAGDRNDAGKDLTARIERKWGVTVGPMGPVPHEYALSQVGHGEAQCRWCLGTNRENAIIAPNHCAERARRDATQTEKAPSAALATLQTTARANVAARPRAKGQDAAGEIEGEVK